MVWFATSLETAIMLWRLERGDGVTLGFAGHDRNLWREGLLYRAAPGMRLSAIELTSDPAAETMDVEGVLSDDSISEADLAAGRWRAARLSIGLADWSDTERAIDWLFHGQFGEIVQREGAFQVELLSGKRMLESPLCPRISPSCRAEFGDRQCGLSRTAYRRIAVVAETPMAGETGIAFSGIDSGNAPDYAEGHVRWLSGANRGLQHRILGSNGARLYMVQQPCLPVLAGDRVLLTQGCDKSLATCSSRFDNVVNFRGEPHLPGNDLLTRYPG